MTKGETSTPTREQNIALQCPKLNESNYTTWAIMMETILKAYGLWETLEATEVTDEKKMNTTKAMILTTLPEDILMQVAQYSKAKEVWESIKVRYIGEDRVENARLQTLRSELETLKMKNNETVSDFARKLGSIRGKFKSLGSTLKDKTLSVPKQFLPIVASIEQYSEIDTMSFEEAMGRIITFEERIKSQDEPEENYQNKLLMARSSNQNHGSGRGRNFSKGEKGRGTTFPDSKDASNPCLFVPYFKREEFIKSRVNHAFYLMLTSSTLTQAALDAFCQKYHIPDTVHPELPAPNQSIHDNPAGKIGVYTRFFEFANFRLSFWNDSFFWVDASVFPLSVPWHTKKTVTRDPSPTVDEFSAEARDFLATHRALGRVIPLVGGNEQGDQHDNVRDVEPHDLNEVIGDAAVADQTEESDSLVQGEEVNIVVDENVQTAVADKPKVQKKRRRAGGASGSDHPPKRLRDDHGTSGNVSSSTGGKSLAAIQELFE
ncbi:hypothetical protein Tco_0646544 [Tanacetum coccineum]